MSKALSLKDGRASLTSLGSPDKLSGSLIELETYLRSPLVRCRPWVDVSPVLSLDRRIFIAEYKYSQKVLIKCCCYCSTKLEMLEVSASWLFHAAMNILWERKYLVSDSFYSAATHGLGTFQILPKSKSLPVHPSLYFLFRIHQSPTSPRCRVLLVNGLICKTRGVQFAILITSLSWRGGVSYPSVLPSPSGLGLLLVSTRLASTWNRDHF